MVFDGERYDDRHRVIQKLFLKYFFLEHHQWEIIIKCTEARKNPITKGFLEHYHYWIEEVNQLDSPKVSEEQVINLVSKHFPIAIQSYIQTTRERKFLDIW